MNFDLTTPCRDCPFRTDLRPFLRPERARQICHSVVVRQESFPCHKTLVYDGDGEGRNTPKTQHCAGAAIMLEKMERPNQWMRIAERLGVYDMRRMDLSAPVYDTPQQMVAAYSEEEVRCLQSAHIGFTTKKTRKPVSSSPLVPRKPSGTSPKAGKRNPPPPLK